ncbi:MAG: hypothetical protein MUE67_04155, partial [Anaerolineales bacterium]|nr:hypothetical protein [Anaerolineales bacterium]
MFQKTLVIFILGQLTSLAAAGAAMFWPAGRLDWAAAWAILGVWLVWFTAEDLVLLRFNPGLIAERLAPPRDAAAWDRALVSTIRLLELARYILAGFDQRYGWTGDFPQAAQWVGLAACLLGTGLFHWSMASNRYFSQVVRLQSERGHSVANGGPYRFVRHPAYLAMIVFEVAISIVLGSWPAILVG